MRYYEAYLDVARRHGVGIVLESATWRANPDWGRELGYAPADLERLNRAAIALLQELRDAHADAVSPIVLSGCIGPRGDGYSPDAQLGADEAHAYHAAQVRTFAGSAAQMVAAMTITYAEEAIGSPARRARPACPSRSRSPSRPTAGCRAASRSPRPSRRSTPTTGGPDLLHAQLRAPDALRARARDRRAVVERILGLRANASRRSHEELDAAEELDEGDPAELAGAHARLRVLMPTLRVLGGCCGTDHRHVDAIAAAWFEAG